MEKQGPARHVQKGRKSSHPFQLGVTHEFPVGLDSRFVKQEPEENPPQPWDAQWQDFLKAMQASRTGQKHGHVPSPAWSGDGSRSSFKGIADLSQRPGRKSLTGLLPDPSENCQGLLSPVRVKEEILEEEEEEEEALDSETERQRFRQFCYQAAEGPKESFYQLQELCWQWLKPERRTKKQILELLVLEQFLAILPPEMQSWVKEGKPESCAQTLALAEGYLLQGQEADGLQGKVSCPGEEEVVVYSPKSEEVQSEVVNLSAGAEEGSDGEASFLGNDQGYENEEETFSFERHPQVGIGGLSLARLNGKFYQVCGLEEMPESEPHQEIHQENQSGIPAIFHEESLQENTFLEGRQKGKRRNAGPSWGTVLNHGFEFPPNRKMQKLYTCTYCGKISNNSAHMIIHERTHTGEKPYKCSECGKCFSTNCNLMKHTRVHTGEKPYQCTDCGRSFSDKASLIVHERTHTGEKPYECPMCGKSFTSSSNLITHKRVHTGEKPYKCSECGQSFVHRPQLVIHIRTHTGEKPYECPECGKSFNQKADLIIHGRTHTGEKPYECPECGKSFISSSYLRKHERLHTGKRVQAGEETHKCGYCRKTFISRSKLLIHERTHTGEKPFECAECGKSFSTSSNLVNHKRVHTGEKPYQCSDCGQKFSTNSNLVNHRRVHTGEKPYKCSDCGQSFGHKASLRRHKRIHSREATRFMLGTGTKC